MTLRSLDAIQQALREGSRTCETLVEAYLQRIEANKALNIYVEVYAEEALQRARTLDEKLRHAPDQLGALHGLVVSHKDVICYADHGVTAASKMLQGYTTPFSATAIERLLQADAILIGRTNCDEFAMGSANTHSVYGPSRNGADPDRVPGGSSGASAVSVQMDTCLLSLGSDTGGSVRQPAAFCGVLGFKPSYGRISRHGLLAYGSSFDQIGLLGWRVDDMARTLQQIAGADQYDATCSQRDVPDYRQALQHPAGPKKIALLKGTTDHPDLDPEIRQATQAYLEQLDSAGHDLQTVDFEYLDYLIPAYYVLTTAEASSNLSRYDGIRYGYRSASAKNLIDTYKQSRTEGFGLEVKRRIMLGTFVLSSGYYDAYYAKAQQVRRLIQTATQAILRDYDFILLPTAPSTAWTLGEKRDDPVAAYLSDIFTVQANMAGIPAISVPIGTAANGLPIGVQFMGPAWQEAELLQFAAQLPPAGS